MEEHSNPGTAIAAGVLLGMGFAGFFDGIVLHQVLQWHHMLTSVRPPTSLANLEANTFWDGIFHLGASVFTIVGLGLLWQSLKTQPTLVSASQLIGAMLLGAGSFNVIEGLIDHHLLGIHHVKAGPHQLGWDIGFLVVSTGLAIGGWRMLQTSSHSVANE